MSHVSIIMLLLLVTACGQREQSPLTTDADFQEKLAGTWINEMDVGDEGHYRAVIVYRPDGVYAGESTIVGSNKTKRASEAGTFLVRGGRLIVTMTKHNSTNAPVPRVDRMRIVRIDDRELVVIHEERPDWGSVTNRRAR